MHKTAIRFLLIRNDQPIEAFLDERLSFNDNLTIINSLCEEDLSHFEIYDPVKMIFLDKDTPLKNFDLQGFPLFYLFN